MLAQKRNCEENTCKEIINFNFRGINEGKEAVLVHGLRLITGQKTS